MSFRRNASCFITCNASSFNAPQNEGMPKQNLDAIQNAFGSGLRG